MPGENPLSWPVFVRARPKFLSQNPPPGPHPAKTVLRLWVRRPASPGGRRHLPEYPMTHTLSARLVRFIKREEGVTAVECALLLALVVTICLLTLAPSVARSDTGTRPTVVLETDAN
jgi:Flp pilus assembly pilin Flp